MRDLAIVAIAFVVAGVVVGRIWAFLLPFVLWGLFYLSLQQGWWGAGVGDGWQYVMVFTILLSLAATAVGLIIRRVTVLVVARAGSTRRTPGDPRSH
jgi:hypothetical protein